MFMINSSSANFAPISIHAAMATADLAPNVKMPYPGQTVEAFDPIFGFAYFVTAFGVASLAVGDVVSVVEPSNATTRIVAATKGPIAVSMCANTSTTALSWFCVAGAVPTKAATIAGNNVPLYTSATTGALTTTVTATQGVTGAFSGSILTSATVNTVLANTVNNSTQVQVFSIDGLFVGATVTGTGIPASTTITSIGMGGQMPGMTTAAPYYITLNNAATASGQATLTVSTGTGFLISTLQWPVASGLG